MSTDKKQQLEQKLWSIAYTLRGKMDANDFRDYILGIIFYKYLNPLRTASPKTTPSYPV